MKLDYSDINQPSIAQLEETSPIITKDCYAYRPYSFKAFDDIIDIGANSGTASLHTRMLFPHANIYTFEPNPRGYASCVKLRSLFKKMLGRRAQGNWEVYNIGLGGGNPVYLHKEHEGNTRDGIFEDYNKGTKPALGGVFVSAQDNADYTGEVLETMTFPAIIKMINLDLSKNISLKIDCECCESYLYNSESWEILRNFRHIAGELHFPTEIGFNGFNSCPSCVSFEAHKKFLGSFTDIFDLHYFSYNAGRGVENFTLTRKEDNIEPCPDIRWRNITP